MQALHEERHAVAALEEQFQMQFDFGGVQSETAAAGLLRASKGATVQGVHALRWPWSCCVEQGGGRVFRSRIRAS